jgi:hypothetical protein
VNTLVDNISLSLARPAHSHHDEALLRACLCGPAHMRPCVSRRFFLLPFPRTQSRFPHSWTKEDHEIFDLVSALEASEGKGTTFYSFLGVQPQADLKAINRQYRKRSLDLQYVRRACFGSSQTYIFRLQPG